MARTVKGNKNVCQSYLLTTARYNLTLTEKRILYRLVEIADNVIKQSDPYFKGRTPIIDFSLFGDAKITLHLTDVLPQGSTNYNEAQKAFKSLCDKVIEIDTKEEYYKCHFLNSLTINKFTGAVVLKIENTIWKIICNFAKGYRKYELLTAFQLKSVYSMRMYELVSNNHTILSMTIDQLRSMFCLEDKYKNVNDLFKRTLDIAKKELDAVSPYSFNYVLTKENRKVVKVEIIPVHKIKNHDEGLYEKELQSKLSTSAFLTRNLLLILQQQCHFTSKEIKSNKKLFIEALNTVPDFETKLSNLTYDPGILKAENPKGWIIGAVKNMVEQTQISKV